MDTPIGRQIVESLSRGKRLTSVVGFIAFGLSIAVLASSTASSSSPATSEPTVDEIEVRGSFLTASDAQTLGQLLAAEKIVDSLRTRSPKAELRFKVFGRKDTDQWSDAGLELLTRDGRVPATLYQEGRFAIDDAWRGLDPDTKLRSRLQDGRVSWRVEIRTPGSTTHTRRLGDLRLQCEASF